MTAKDIAQIENKLNDIFVRVGNLDTALAVILEKFDHVLTRSDMEKEITKQIELEQAHCPNRIASNNTTDWVRIIKIIGIVSVPIISAITGHQIGVN